MKKSVFWTPHAEDTFREIVDYLRKEWNENISDNFVEKTHSVLELTSSFPNIYKQIDKSRNIRKGLVTKNISFFYRVKRETLEILYFWDNRRNPDTSEY